MSARQYGEVPGGSAPGTTQIHKLYITGLPVPGCGTQESRSCLSPVWHQKALGKSRACALPSNRVQLVLAEGVQMSQLQGWERGRVGPSACLLAVRCTECKDNVPHLLLPPAAFWRTGPEVIRQSGQALLLDFCPTQEHGPCSLPGQYSGAGPDREGTGEPGLRV